MSAEMPKMPEPVAFYETEGDEWHIYPRGTSTYEHIRDHQKARIGVHVFALYTAAQLQEAARQAMERIEPLRHAGAMLSNCAFNLAQRNPGQFTARDIEALDSSRKAWDEALRALLPQDPDHLAGVGNMVEAPTSGSGPEKRHG